MIRIHYLQHVPFEDPAYILSFATHKGFSVTSTKLYEESSLPDSSSFDWLFIMGGPMGVYEEQRFPWLRREKRFIEHAIKNQKLVLGICLGAQLIADVLGARVMKNNQKEIGWFTVRSTATPEERTNAIVNSFPDLYTAFHWHGDTFEIPSGALRFAASEACENQGFLYNDRVIALQFHLETTWESIKRLIDNCKSDITEGSFVQHPLEIYSRGGHPIQEANALLENVLEACEAIPLGEARPKRKWWGFFRAGKCP